MVKYVCDVCGEECMGVKYRLPVYKQIGYNIGLDGGPIYGFVPQKYHLCKECCEDIYDIIKKKMGDI